MKSNQIEQGASEKPEFELKLLPEGAFGELETKAQNYDGGFHIKAPANNNKRVIGKRSGFQGFTCR